MALNSIYSRAEQFLIHFACRTTTRKELTPVQKDTLQNLLSESNSDLFQRFEDKLPQGILFQAVREFEVGALTVTGPTFNMTHDSVSIIKPLKIGTYNLVSNNDVTAYLSNYMRTFNQEMATILNNIATSINGLKYKRAGKIFEIALPHIAPNEKRNLLQELVNYNLDDVGEVNFSFTRYTNFEERLYNIKTQIMYQQLEIGNPFHLNVRVDINNRNFIESMEPTLIQQIWLNADSTIEAHFNSFLNL